MKGSSYKNLRLALMEMRWINRPLEWWAKNVSQADALSGREIIYQNLLHRELARMGIDRALYPVGGAANHSYLYLLIRICTELPVRRVLELGCGQSTLLLDSLAELQSLEVVSLEHESLWAQQIGKQCAHARVVEAPLIRSRVQQRETDVYDSEEAAAFSADILLIDGPQKTKRFSRWGALRWLEQLAREDFVVIFDDAERRGELDTIAEALRMLDRRGIRYVATRFRSVKTQFLIAGGRMMPAVYF